MDSRVSELVDRWITVVIGMRSAGLGPLELQGNSVWFGRFRSSMRELENIRREIERANPVAIDHRLIQWEINESAVSAVRVERFNEAHFRDRMTRVISDLVAYRGTREIHIQLVHLVCRSTFKFGDVEIRPILNYGDDLEEYNLKFESDVKSPDPNAIYAYAVVNHAPGHSSMAERNAIDTVENVLRLVRGIGLPTLFSKRWKQFGVEGRSPGSSWAITRRGPGGWNSAVNPTIIDDYAFMTNLIPNYDEVEIGRLEQLYSATTRTDIERKVLQAHYWMGDATLPGSNEEKYAKLSMAFETAVGGQAKLITEIGISEMLAERTAFLIERLPEGRSLWHQSIKTLYGLRSGLLHGDAKPISDVQLLQWAWAVWLVVREMLRRSRDFATVNDLAQWTRQMRWA